MTPLSGNRPLRMLLPFLLAFGTTQALAQDQSVEQRPLGPPPAGITLDLGQSTAAQGDVFRIGFLADAAPDHQRRIYQPFRDYAEAVLQRPVELVPYNDARGLVIAIGRRTVEYAMAPGSVFAAAHRQCACVEPIGVQPNRDGTMGLMATILVGNAPTAPQNLGDLSSSPMAIVGRDSVIAHRVGISELWRNDVSISEVSVVFADTLFQAIQYLRNGDVSAILTWTRQEQGSVVFDQEPFALLTDEQRRQLKVLWRARAVPGFTHFMHQELQPDIQTLLQDMLLRIARTDGDAFDAVDQGSGRGFVATTLSDYQAYLDAYSYWDQVNLTSR